MKKLSDQLNKKTDSKIQVVEYMPEGDNPEAAFERMVKKNDVCDGLVISGHHYGEWEGVRADGSLKLDFIEKLSCNPKYSNWFKNIKSLHLQGCRTSGVGNIESNRANDHTIRVNRAIMPDSIEQGMEDLNYGFTNILSRNNPLSARYLKAFPRATSFGWVDSAPGFEARSELSLLHHIAYMAKINQPSKLIDPTKDLSSEDAVALATATLDMLQKPDFDRCENMSIQGWEQQRSGAKGFRSFENAAINNPSLIRARSLGCRFKFPSSHIDRIKVLREILKDKKLIAENFNFMAEVLQGNLSTEQKKDLTSLMARSENLRAFIGDELNTEQTGLFVKIDYYTFYKKIFDERSSSMESIINNEAFKYLLEAYPNDPPNNPSSKKLDMIAFKRTLVQSLGKNGYVDESFMQKLYDKGTPMAHKMFNTIFNVMLAESQLNSLPEMAQLVRKLQPLKDSIDK